MQKKTEVKTGENKDTRPEGLAQEATEVAEKEREPKEKPLEHMTKVELLEKIKALQEEAEKEHDLYLRSEAEIENLKKRSRKEKEEWVKYSNETLIKQILPAMDHLEMAISHSHNENSFGALREGVELTLKGLKDTLGKSGLQEVKAMGETFDPSFHEAVSELEDEKVEAGKIVRELQKGYILNNRLIRPATVIVSKGKPSNSSGSEGTAEVEE